MTPLNQKLPPNSLVTDLTQLPSLNNPTAIAYNNGNIWVAEQSSSTIAFVSNFQDQLTTHALPTGNYAAGIAFDSNNQAWFSDPAKTSYGYVSNAGSVTIEPLASPHGVGITGTVAGTDGYIYFGVPGSNEIIQVKPSTPGLAGTVNFGTGYAPKFGTTGAGYLWFTSNGILMRVGFSGGTVSFAPYAIAPGNTWGQIVTGADGNLYVSDQSLKGIWKITLTSGTPMSAVGINTNGTPAGLAAGVNGDTDIYVSVPSADAVRAVNPVSYAIDSSLGVSSGGGPESVTVTPDDSIWWGEGGTNFLGTFGDAQVNGSIYIDYIPTGAPYKWGGITVGKIEAFPKGPNNTNIQSYQNDCNPAYSANTGGYPVGYAVAGMTTSVQPISISGESECPVIFSSLYGEASQMLPIPSN